MNEEDHQQEEGGAPPWMATFADLSTLLLTFFVLLLTFAEMDVVKFKDALGSIQAALGGGVIVVGHAETSPPTISTSDLPVDPTLAPPKVVVEEVEASMKEIADIVQKMVEDQNLMEDVEVEQVGRGVVVRVKGRLFFSPGTADLIEEAKSVLDHIGQIMLQFPYEMSIEGHTDNTAISGGRYSSNWDLSTARAYSALQHIQGIEGIDAKKLHISGFADTKPVDTNETEEGRARNRRVEFVFYKGNQDDAEAGGALPVAADSLPAPASSD
jgi:chemotaxis protein MotB